MSSLFISHSAPDNEIATALKDAIYTLLSEDQSLIKINYSSSAQSGPQGGEEWRTWIEQQIIDAQTVLVILTPESVTRHWPIWEAAACRGVALLRESQCKGEDNAHIYPKIIGITYGISNTECPDPLRKEQIISGENRAQMEELFIQIMDYHNISRSLTMEAGRKMDATLDTYLVKVSKSLLDTSSLVNEASVQDWLSRLNNLAQAKRWSELENYQHWMNIAFGQDQTNMRPQIDLRLHRRLGDYYLEQRNLSLAIEQLRLARKSAPRDIYVLSRLSEALIKNRLENTETDLEPEIEELLSRINELDPYALYSNPDSAALAAKYQRKIKNAPETAIEIYTKALEHNPKSYYLADVLGQTQIETGALRNAKQTYQKAKNILKDLSDRNENIWSLATEVTSNIVLDNVDDAKESIRKITKLNPTENQLIAIKSGINDICDKLNISSKVTQSILESFSQEN